MPFLNDFVNGNESFECLHLVREYGLYSKPTPERDRAVVIPGIDDAFYERLRIKLIEMNGAHFGRVSALEPFLRYSWPSLC